MKDTEAFSTYLRRVGQDFADSSMTSTAKDYADAAAVIDNLMAAATKAKAALNVVLLDSKVTLTPMTWRQAERAVVEVGVALINASRGPE